MRTTLLNKVGVRKIFVATFISYGSFKTREGDCATALLFDVKDHGTVCSEHAWVKITPEFMKVGILNKGDKIMFSAKVVFYPKSHVRVKWDIGLHQLTKVKKAVGK